MNQSTDTNVMSPAQFKWVMEASCLDAVYERLDIAQGNLAPENAKFPENKEGLDG